MEARYKCRKCLSCEQLCENPGDLVCGRCGIPHAEPPKKYKLMLVDDDLKFTKDLKKKLEATLYFEVVTAYDGAKGYEKIAYEKPELILMDVFMPRLNGPDFMAKLRQHEDPILRRLPVIVMLEKEKNASLFEAGDIQGMIHKPVPLRELFEMMTELLRIRKAA